MSKMEEMRRTQLEMQRKGAERQLQANAGVIDIFREHCSNLESPVTDLQVGHLETIVLVAQAPGLLRHLCPNLTIDKDGPYDLNQLCALFKSAPFPGTDLMVANNFMLMAHRYPA